MALSVEILGSTVRPAVLGRSLGDIFRLIALSGLVPAAFAVIVGDYAHAAGCALLVVVLGGAGWTLSRLDANEDLRQHEAMVVVCLAFLTAAVAYTVPLLTAGVDPLDSLFEAVSGITTTGLSTFDSVSDKPRSLVFTAAWLQWLGGLGIVVLSFPLLFGQGMQARKLTAVLVESGGAMGGIRRYARTALATYSAVTVACFVLLWASGANWFDAAALALASVSTGGFAPSDGSLAPLSQTLQGIVIVFCVLGAVAFPVMHEAATGRIAAIFKDSEFQLLLLLGAILTLVVGLDRLGQAGAFRFHDLAAAAATAFSAQTTAGFSALPVAELDASSRLAMTASMAIGGGMGSSAGGIKLLRLIILIRVCQLFILRTRLPEHAESTVRAMGRSWTDTEVTRVLAMTGVFVLAIIFFWFAFVLFGYDPLNALFEVVSAIGTVGLSTGICGPDLEPGLKLLLCLAMLMGRLDVLAVLVLLAPGTWWQRTHTTSTSTEGEK